MEKPPNCWEFQVVQLVPPVQLQLGHLEALEVKSLVLSSGPICFESVVFRDFKFQL